MSSLDNSNFPPAYHKYSICDRFNPFNTPERSMLPVTTQLVGEEQKQGINSLSLHNKPNTNCNSCSGLSRAVKLFINTIQILHTDQTTTDCQWKLHPSTISSTAGTQNPRGLCCRALCTRTQLLLQTSREVSSTYLVVWCVEKKSIKHYWSHITFALRDDTHKGTPKEFLLPVIGKSKYLLSLSWYWFPA